MNNLYYSPQELAGLLRVSVRTLANWRCLEKGPRYSKVSGKSIMYPKVEVLKYIKENMKGGQ